MTRFLRIALVILAAACSSQTQEQRLADYVALIEAAESGQPAKVEALLTRGTPVDVGAQPGSDAVGSAWVPYAERPSPLFVAAANGHLEVVKTLLKRKPWLEWHCCDSLTPLGTAAANGHREIVEALLAAGADPTVKSAGGMSALEAARARGHGEIARMLENAMEQGR